MGAFDWLTRRRAARKSADLRESLVAAVGRKDYDLLGHLINANTSEIRKAFPSWTTVPPEIRNDPRAMSGYVDTLSTIATVFERSGDASLMKLLQDGDPTREWNNAITAAQTLIDQKRASEAVTVLRSLLDDMERLSGSAPDHYRPRVLGKLGVALFYSGDRREAIAVTRQALELCRSLGDEEGVGAYTHNLDEIGTFGMPANGRSEGNGTVAFSNEQGDTLTLDELRMAQGTVKWEGRMGPPVPPEAKRLHQEGREAGARRDYGQALLLLTRAAEAAPLWPYPVYDRAFTHLLQRNFDAALSDYRRTMELAPQGFFTAEIALDTLTREAEGEFHTGLYAAFAMLEQMPRETRDAIVRQLVEQCPSFAPGWNELAGLVTDPVKRLEVIENGLAARPDPQTRGLLIVNKALTMSALGDSAGALALLQQLLADSTGSLAPRVWAEFALTRLSSNPQQQG
jgi:tetratricopeptide (TPR) repeat protein